MNRNDYYVYGHYLVENDTLFYIGKGRLGRKDSKSDRSQSWNVLTKSNDWYSKVLYGNLTEQESLDIEFSLINSLTGLVNTVKKNKRHENIDFTKIFYYDETSPTCLRWKVWNKQTNRSRRDAGDIAGYLSKGSDNITLSYRVGIYGKEFKVHRIIAALQGLNYINYVIDHIDGDPLNNKIGNLRVITQEKNCRNSTLRSDNTTGKAGVGFIVVNGFYMYQARWKENGKSRSKSFAISKYGLLPAFTLACEWRKNKIEELNAAGAGYTDRHGT